MLNEALLKIAKVWKKLKCPSMPEWIKKHVCIWIFSHKKRNIAIYNNMDGPLGHYINWNNSEIQRTDWWLQKVRMGVREIGKLLLFLFVV